VIEIHPDQKEYFVVSNVKGGQGPHSTLRFNESETALLCLLGNDTVTLKLIPEQGKRGLYETNFMVRGTFPQGREINRSGHHEQTIEDFSTIGDDKIILANSLGVIDVFKYSTVPLQSQAMGVNASQMGNKKVELSQPIKLDSYDINFNKQVNYHEMITSISVHKTIDSSMNSLISVATIQNNQGGDREGRLRCIHILKFNHQTNQLTLLCTKDFGLNQAAKSLYYWLDFSHTFRGQNILLAF